MFGSQVEWTAVLGGLEGLASPSEATTWLKDKLSTLGGPHVVHTYINSNEFKGMNLIETWPFP